jgi:hypothetical protein
VAIEKLISAELYSVTFVRDYIQFSFHCDKNDACLTAHSLPSVTLNDVDYSFETNGYRDALCSLINQIVKDIKMQDNDSINVIFEGDDVLSICPTQRERETLVEFAVFHYDDIWQVWN